MADAQPLVLTLKLDADSFEIFNTLRQQHFPAKRNFLPAHVTLFHALPGHQFDAICIRLREVCEVTTPIPVHFSKVRFLGKGVAIQIEAPALQQLHQRLASEWKGWLTRQDQQPYNPHITVQNKVEPEVARSLFNQLNQDWDAFSGYGEGLLLWSYQGGPWSLREEFVF